MQPSRATETSVSQVARRHSPNCRCAGTGRMFWTKITERGDVVITRYGKCPVKLVRFGGSR